MNLAELTQLVVNMRDQLLRNQLALMRRLSIGWTEDGAKVLEAAIGETQAALDAPLTRQINLPSRLSNGSRAADRG